MIHFENHVRKAVKWKRQNDEDQTYQKFGDQRIPSAEKDDMHYISTTAAAATATAAITTCKDKFL
jgi:hypothetical protein